MNLNFLMRHMCGCCQQEDDENHVNIAPISAVQLNDEPIHDESPIKDVPPAATAATKEKRVRSKAKSKAASSPQEVPLVAAATPANPSTKRPPSKSKPVDPRVQVQKLIEEGNDLFDYMDYAAATETYERALTLDSSAAGAWAGRGGCRLRLNDLDGALADLNEAMRIEPNHILALRDRAQTKKELGDIDGAIADYDVKIRMAPADGKSLVGRGELRLQTGDKDGAIQDFTLASRLCFPGAQELLSKAKAK